MSPFNKQKLTRDRLRHAVEYDAETGIFIWRTPRQGIQVGAVAGSVDSKGGYVRFMLDGRHRLAHRMAWLHVHGEQPPGAIDHINRVKTDNRICNLRIATTQENAWNRGVSKNNTSGFKGVTMDPRTGRWKSVCDSGGRHWFLGTFDTKEDAAHAYDRFITRFGGEFAATNCELVLIPMLAAAGSSK